MFGLNLIKKRIHYRKLNLSIGDHVQIIGNVDFGENCALMAGAVFSESSIGSYSYINYHSIVHVTTIGRFCSIGPNVVIGLGNHPVTSNVSTSPKTFLAGIFTEQTMYNQFSPVIIGNDVWIGANVTILNGVTIGDGAVIGANSIVIKNIPPYAVYAGVPAKFLRFRFSEEQIQSLLSLQWWNKDNQWLKENCSKFNNIEILLKDKK